ncbi:cryptochrome/photolyase family protein [Pedobacter hartonius]|uniref:Deoxyribodipyrimidine photolyase-related protein n=1 Tax=Pedobacter hartonius TaxID=425514 RepID=A0A1H3ZX00_9SPHI|nr:cryptochrome/photolyase family protein [Pedobacter hartonius]SEA28185.1 deoxyribodipyrimidine photolyase-related protein [Pedobacter hartonius]
MESTYKKLRLLLGDQLNLQHSWFSHKDQSTLYVLMEIRTETDYVWHHIQKACAFFAAMEGFAETLNNDGHDTLYFKLDDPANKQSFSANCDALIKKYHIESFEYQLPDEYRLDEELKAYCDTLKIPCQAYDTEHFYTTRDELATFFTGKKGLLMENFYREMRKKHDVLMAGDEPVGGKWNFDEDNRNKLPKTHKPHLPLLFNNAVQPQYDRIRNAGIETIGSIDLQNLYWPVNRQQSLELLRYFTENCLPLFGTFQDAMHTDEWSIYHSRLSFSMNTKMLSPREVIGAAHAAWEQNKKAISINQLEGFVRQILGWREYMRGIYWLKMPGFETLNYFDHQRKLPGWYWTGKTKMNCMKHSIGQSLNHAYAHHIQRLMITGNFALLAGIKPDEVDFWYLGIYIDAIQWVEITNTRGMSQYADGGIIGSKPYTASANYIHKQSNYCDNCHYDRTKRIGESSCPFNSLYWDFHDRHRDKLSNNFRLSMVYRLWDKMALHDRDAILLRADFCLENLEEL